ncbi:hypothetical protein DEU31_0775 [Brachybacterium sp. AG952]|uniref:PIN-like domain-containing protein n=1 Tax=Brachybacterium sp. AG952 TaxID=2183989 RepID=UPI001061508C|nr:PIN-like domain-containing protein [Brachybacterium sp. AG952]TDP80341.1 hypothetical protein DEU31_0775 [Brachybacterium sp. AG952]
MTEHDMLDGNPASEIDLTFEVLNRDTTYSVIEHLADSLRKTQETPQGALSDFSLSSRIAIGLDTNALFRIGLNGASGADAVDYLASVHDAPLIIPGQVVQEVWNNALSAVQPNAKRIKKEIEDLSSEVEKLDRSLGPHSEELITAAHAFTQWHGDWIDENNQKAFVGTLSNLAARAISKSVPRVRFSRLAQIRNDTKTPPGFADPDSNHGDFFVWADFLYALASSDLTDVHGVLLITEDQKQDWSRTGVAHPVLSAEVEALTGLPFAVCTLKQFYTLVREVTK